MQLFIIISVVAVVFSILPIASGLKCYHCISGEASIGVKSLCNDPDKMKSSDCGDSSNYVETEMGYMPLDVASSLGYTGASAAIRANFKCMKYSASGSEELGNNGAVSYEITARSCLGSLPGSTNLWDRCENNADCHLCDTDDCNDASTIISSFIFLILALMLSFYM